MLKHKPSRLKHHRKLGKKGFGLINTIINKLPFELHIPGYQYCGPGTKLEKRLARGDKGINPLDTSCLHHDQAYKRNPDLEDRHKADYELEQRAWERVKSRDADLKEKAAAWAVVNAMKIKRKIGMGMHKKRKVGMGIRKRKRKVIKRKKGTALSFNQAVRKAKHGIGKRKSSDGIITLARQALSSIGRKKLQSPKKRIIPIPKTGGFLPLIPLFAALSALGSLGGGISGIVKAVNAAKTAKEGLAEQKRHDMTMEQAIGKGLYIRPYKKGMGLYLEPYKKNFQ